MNNFINHLLSRHIDLGMNVKPRIRSRFEPVIGFPGIYPDAASAGSNIAEENGSAFPLQNQESFKFPSSDESNAPTQQPLPLFSEVSGEKATINNELLKSSFPRPPYEKDNASLYRKKEKNF